MLPPARVLGVPPSLVCLELSWPLLAPFPVPFHRLKVERKPLSLTCGRERGSRAIDRHSLRAMPSVCLLKDPKLSAGPLGKVYLLTACAHFL